MCRGKNQKACNSNGESFVVYWPELWISSLYTQDHTPKRQSCVYKKMVGIKVTWKRLTVGYILCKIDLMTCNIIHISIDCISRVEETYLKYMRASPILICMGTKINKSPMPARDEAPISLHRSPSTTSASIGPSIR